MISHVMYLQQHHIGLYSKTSLILEIYVFTFLFKTFFLINQKKQKKKTNDFPQLHISRAYYAEISQPIPYYHLKDSLKSNIPL
jgi:hypothetical protein